MQLIAHFTQLMQLITHFAQYFQYVMQGCGKLVKSELFVASGEFRQISKYIYMLMVSLTRPDQENQGIQAEIIMEIIVTTFIHGTWKTKGRSSEGNRANVDPQYNATRNVLIKLIFIHEQFEKSVIRVKTFLTPSPMPHFAIFYLVLPPDIH